MKIYKAVGYRSFHLIPRIQRWGSAWQLLWLYWEWVLDFNGSNHSPG